MCECSGKWCSIGHSNATRKDNLLSSDYWFQACNGDTALYFLFLNTLHTVGYKERDGASECPCSVRGGCQTWIQFHLLELHTCTLMFTCPFSFFLTSL